jgi:hypothetical protein
MRTPFPVIGILIELLATGLTAQENKQPAPADNISKVTYIANG